MFLLYKKGDRGLPENYRTIALTNSIAKLFTAIIANRISVWAENYGLLRESQNGFRRGRGCTDGLYILSSVIGVQLNKYRGKLFAFFVDFRQAFDRICHNLLWKKLLAFGLSSKIVLLLSDFYSKAMASIDINGELTDGIPIRNGVLQGDTLSPLLFSLFLSDFDAHLLSQGAFGVDLWGDVSISSIFYADDLIFLADCFITFGLRLRRFIVDAIS